MNLGCEVEILSGVYIPFKPSRNLEENHRNVQYEMRDVKEFKEVKEVFIKDPKINQLEIQMEHQIRNQLNIRNDTDNDDGVCNLLSMKNENENENENVEVKNSNFYSTVKELMLERLKYPKGSYMNLLYKFLANAGIGQMARGLSQKVRYDSQTNSTKVLTSGDLVSPLYAG